MRTWICSLEVSATRLRLTLASVGSDRMPVPLERRFWKIGVRPKTVLSQLGRWEKYYSARIGSIALASVTGVPMSLLYALKAHYRLVAVDPAQLREVLEAWRREVSHRWRKSEWLCLLGQGPTDQALRPHSWVLLRLRGQFQSLDSFLGDEFFFEHDGDMVYVSCLR